MKEPLYPGWNQANHLQGMPGELIRRIAIATVHECDYCRGQGTKEIVHQWWRIERVVCPICHGTGRV